MINTIILPIGAESYYLAMLYLSQDTSYNYDAIVLPFVWIQGVVAIFHSKCTILLKDKNKKMWKDKEIIMIIFSDD